MKISIIGQVLGKLFIFGKYVLDLFFPVKNNTKNAPFISEPAHCLAQYYNAETNTRALLPYKNPYIKRLIWDFKYYLRPYALNFCTNTMYDELLADMSDRISAIPLSKPHLVIYCPSSIFLKGEKDFDHMQVLLYEIEKRMGINEPFFIACVHAVLPNTLHFGEMGGVLKAQHISSREERLSFAQKRFILSKEFIKFIRGDDLTNTRDSAGKRHTFKNKVEQHIYCIDDVTTTGASFLAIKNLLENEFKDTEQRKLFKLKCIALSH